MYVHGITSDKPSSILLLVQIRGVIYWHRLTGQCATVPGLSAPVRLTRRLPWAWNLGNRKCGRVNPVRVVNGTDPETVPVRTCKLSVENPRNFAALFLQRKYGLKRVTARHVWCTEICTLCRVRMVYRGNRVCGDRGKKCTGLYMLVADGARLRRQHKKS